MTGQQTSGPFTVDRFNRIAADIPDMGIRVWAIPDLLSRFLSHPPGPGFETQQAQTFRPEDFIRPFLDDEEINRLNRFKVLKKQVEWSCGRFAVKNLAKETLLSENTLAEIRISTHEEGAPYLFYLPGHSLTLSHSRNLTATALGLIPGLTLGIDIEAVGPMPDQAFLKTAFTRREIQAMTPCPEDVFRCWTLKEAYLKFIKKGFNESLHRVEIIGNRIFHGGLAQPVTCKSWFLDQGYSLSLVTNHPKTKG